MVQLKAAHEFSALYTQLLFMPVSGCSLFSWTLSYKLFNKMHVEKYTLFCDQLSHTCTYISIHIYAHNWKKLMKAHTFLLIDLCFPGLHLFPFFYFIRRNSSHLVDWFYDLLMEGEKAEMLPLLFSISQGRAPEPTLPQENSENVGCDSSSVFYLNP